MKSHVRPISRVCMLAGAVAICSIFAGCPTSTPTPTISPQPASTSSCPNTVTLTDSNSAATIYFTIDGTQPVPGQGTTKVYQGPFQVNPPVGGAPNVILSADALVANNSAYSLSPVQTTTFTCGATIQVAAPVFSPAPGPYTCPYTVNITDSTPGTELLLNADSASVSWNNHQYLGPFAPQTVNRNISFNAAAVIPGANPPATINVSGDASANYTCATPPPTPYNELTLLITTGNDGINSDSSVNLVVQGPGFSGAPLCLKADNGSCPAGSPSVSQNTPISGNTWPSSEFTIVEIPVTAMTAAQAQSFAGSLQITLKNGDSSCGNPFHEGCDNWRIQSISASFDSTTTRGTNSIPLLTLNGPSNPSDDNCEIFLKAPPNATTVQLSLGGNTNSHTYMNGTSAENGIITTCKDNGDGGSVPQ
jgi:hypothetical protein